MTKLTMLSETSVRWIFAAVGAICVALLCTAYFLQYGPGQQQPCPLCILQRYVYLAIAVVAFGGAAVGPKRSGEILIAGVLGVFAATGAALALWQVTKSDSMASCLSDPVGEFVYGLPMRKWWPEFLAAYGGCADKHPPILGLSAPMWSLIWFTGFVAIFVYIVVKLSKGARY